MLAHRIFPGCNFAFWGEDGFRDLMVRSVQTLLADSGITSQQITSAMLSLTVYGEVPGTEEFFPQVMQSILPDCPLQFPMTLWQAGVAVWPAGPASTL